MKAIPCRVCRSGRSESLGALPDCGEFAGEMITPSIKGGELWRCKDCGSMFRYPTLSPSEYLAFYEKASSGVWEGGESQRKDFATIYAYLKDHPGGSIFDIGCYAGGGLAGLPGKFKKYGVEPSKSASDSATSKGINILGKTLTNLDPKLVFDVVVAIAVVEHVLDVETFLVDALAHVDKNGLLIISTGNPDCFYWRKMFKAKFWYSTYPEHLVFPSFKYYCEFSKRHNLPFSEQIRFKYRDVTFRASCFGIFNQLVYAISPAVFRTWLKLVRSLKGNAIPMAADIPLGAPGIFTDHHVIIFRKQGKQWG